MLYNKTVWFSFLIDIVTMIWFFITAMQHVSQFFSQNCIMICSFARTRFWNSMKTHRWESLQNIIISNTHDFILTLVYTQIVCPISFKIFSSKWIAYIYFLRLKQNRWYHEVSPEVVAIDIINIITWVSSISCLHWKFTCRYLSRNITMSLPRPTRQRAIMVVLLRYVTDEK